VESECTAHNFRLFVNLLPKVIKLGAVGRSLAKFWQTILHSFLDTMYTHTFLVVVSAQLAFSAHYNTLILTYYTYFRQTDSLSRQRLSPYVVLFNKAIIVSSYKYTLLI